MENKFYKGLLKLNLQRFADEGQGEEVMTVTMRKMK